MAEKQTAESLEKEFETPGDKFKEPITPAYREKAGLVADLLTIKMNNIRPWYETKTDTANTGTSKTFYSQRVRVDKTLILTHVSALNKTTANTTTEISIERGGEEIILNRDAPSAANVTIDFDGQAMLIEGDRIKVTFYAGGATDDLHVSMSGYEVQA